MTRDCATLFRHENDRALMRPSRALTSWYLLVAMTTLLSRPVTSSPPPVAVRKPPLGFNTWNHFHMQPSEEVMVATAMNFTTLGLRDAGYIYINSDDGWLYRERSPSGDLVPMAEQFPNGMAALADKLHGMGFHFGIYACASEYTCGSRAGSLYHERHDAKLLASWGVDYLKFDDCGEMNMASYAKFSVMRDAIAETGRPMVYSFEPYTGVPKMWVGAVGNSWRTGPDATPDYGSIIGNAFTNNLYATVSGPGHFNDADMMEIGNGNPGLTLAEARTQMSLWCLMKSPLLIGASLQNIAKPYLDILLNKELIAWNQDDLGIQGYLRASSPYADGSDVGAQPSPRAAAVLAVAHNRLAALSTLSTSSTSSNSHPLSSSLVKDESHGDPFPWVTYCAHGPNPIPSAQVLTLKKSRDQSRVAGAADTMVQQGRMCLTAPKRQASGDVTMQPCDDSAEQLWDAGDVAVTLSHIKTEAGLCLSSNGTYLKVLPCIAKPPNCSSLWNHNSSINGIDCTDDVRNSQFWYLNALGQLISTYVKGMGTQHHPEIVFYDPDDPFCVATAPAPKPDPPALPPNVNTSLPLQVWAGPLVNGSVGVVLMNTGNQSATITATWKDVGLPHGSTVVVRDVWLHKDLHTAYDSVSAVVAPHDVAALLLTPIK
eukprot:m.47117 g.47117  ORF g.47117 m.47117 type:complete len:656 (-) comp6848_c0_seq1:2276-4243(-)